MCTSRFAACPCISRVYSSQLVQDVVDLSAYVLRHGGQIKDQTTSPFLFRVSLQETIPLCLVRHKPPDSSSLCFYSEARSPELGLQQASEVSRNPLEVALHPKPCYTPAPPIGRRHLSAPLSFRRQPASRFPQETADFFGVVTSLRANSVGIQRSLNLGKFIGAPQKVSLQHNPGIALQPDV